eukprot:Plantae.Rhodophyta-Purpureofilum_apyrenoidigerum.ctg19709.p1 GENE.Plantae.Rhodophyta-Purpureofilum_apyrenoidigerum.ctg19709~~Plantae.Rhodophyta-Purpureofilum_apyrenoidigerum.ctg19709.p1  ORF type:complete len:346 (+),score=63.74 Plantae.Rhodophyta-Purpureofilum_apyrenoidigerum.ctg19709:455-1492(+)
MGDTRVDEEDIPPEFNLMYDEANSMCTREVTQFSAHRNGTLVSICDLDKTDTENKEDMQIMLRGLIVSGSKRLRVEVGPLVEWCIEYGNDPSLWAHTSRAWYKILNPAKEYQRTHELARRRFELSARAFILAVTIMKEECTYRNFVNVLAVPYQNMRGYSEKEILMERNFILDQAESLEDPSLKNSGFVKGLRERSKEIKEVAKEKKKEKSSAKKEKGDKEKKEKKHHKKAGAHTWVPRSDKKEILDVLLKKYASCFRPPRVDVAGAVRSWALSYMLSLLWPQELEADSCSHGGRVGISFQPTGRPSCRRMSSVPEHNFGTYGSRDNQQPFERGRALRQYHRCCT